MLKIWPHLEFNIVDKNESMILYSNEELRRRRRRRKKTDTEATMANKTCKLC